MTVTAGQKPNIEKKGLQTPPTPKTTEFITFFNESRGPHTAKCMNLLGFGQPCYKFTFYLYYIAE